MRGNMLGLPSYGAQCRTHVKPMDVRSRVTLELIRLQYGSAFEAALAGAINAEEYLRLETSVRLVR